MDWKTRMGKLFPVREKLGNFEETGKVRKFYQKYWKNEGILPSVYLYFSQIFNKVFYLLNSLNKIVKNGQILKKSGKFVSPKMGEPWFLSGFQVERLQMKWRIQDFPKGGVDLVGGAWTPEAVTFRKICMSKRKNQVPWGGGVRRVRPLDLPIRWQHI